MNRTSSGSMKLEKAIQGFIQSNAATEVAGNGSQVRLRGLAPSRRRAAWLLLARFSTAG